MARLGGLGLPQLLWLHGVSPGGLVLRDYAFLHSTDIADAEAEEGVGTDNPGLGPDR